MGFGPGPTYCLGYLTSCNIYQRGVLSQTSVYFTKLTSKLPDKALREDYPSTQIGSSIVAAVQVLSWLEQINVNLGTEYVAYETANRLFLLLSIGGSETIHILLE